MSTKKNVLWGLAAVFGILTIVFYCVSIQKLDRDAARLLGVSSVVNIQSTIFTGACAVLCGVNVVGAVIISCLEESGAHSGGAGKMATEVVQAIKQNELEEKQKQEAEEKARIEKEQMEQEEEQRKIARQKKIEELKQKRANGEIVETDVFQEEIADMTSMMDIWKVWEKHQLKEAYPEADKTIQKYKETERAYGRLNNIEAIKRQIREQLLGQ